MNSRLTQSEYAVALVLTLVVLSFHYVGAVSAGALWRDEAGMVGLATLPTLKDVWSNLQYDSFPILWPLAIRTVAKLAGPFNDPAFRVLGFLVGAGIVGAIWYYARTLRYSPPLLSLPLLAMHPVLIRPGDTVRAYGAGILLIIVTAALMWRFIREPTPLRFVGVAAAAILSVHALYYNAVLIAAVCFGALAVCAVNRDWKKAAQVLVLGLLAAVSLIPYVAKMRGASRWLVLVRIPDYTIGDFLTKLEGALRLGGVFSSIGWIAAFTLAVICGIAALSRSTRSDIEASCQKVVLFHLVTLISTVVGVFVFLHFLSFSTASWYYLTLMTVAALCIDGLLAAVIRSPRARIIRLGAVVILAGATFIPATRSARALETNANIVASRIQSAARSGDLVVVAEWYLGVSFGRYYKGQVKWLTVPPMDVHRVHRYDLVMQHMKAGDQTAEMRPVLDSVEHTLRGGHDVYVVGILNVLSGCRPPVPFPPAPWRTNVWPLEAFATQWSSMVGYVFCSHAVKFSEIDVYPPAVYNLHENVRLFVASGWRP